MYKSVKIYKYISIQVYHGFSDVKTSYTSVILYEAIFNMSLLKFTVVVSLMVYQYDFGTDRCLISRLTSFRVTPGLCVCISRAYPTE